MQVGVVCLFVLVSGPVHLRTYYFVPTHSRHLCQAITQQHAEGYGLHISRADLVDQWFSSIGVNGQCTSKFSNLISRWNRENRKAQGTASHTDHAPRVACFVLMTQERLRNRPKGKAPMKRLREARFTIN